MSKLFCLVILSCLAFACVPAEEQTWEEKNPICENVCDYVELCGFTLPRDTWFCSETACTDEILVGTPLNDDKMILAWCTDGQGESAKVKENCYYLDQCIADLLSQ
jgi:hypothetical protein